MTQTFMGLPLARNGQNTQITETNAQPMMRRVAIVFPSGVHWIARCIDGVRRYSREQGGWDLLSSPSSVRQSASVTEMHGWDGDGLITLIDDARELRRARRLSIPMVNFGSLLAKPHGIPRVMINHYKGGQLAADHLLNRGLRNLAVFGRREAWYADQRRLGFSDRAAEAGVKCKAFLPTFHEESAKRWIERIAEPAKWLSALPLPCGIFAVHDYRARLLMEACRQARLRIPDDIALIAMDDDETICEHCIPTLTSVSRNSERVGWEAAALLDRLMRGETPPADDLFVDPDQVAARRSTGKLYSADPVVQRALDFLSANLKRQFNVEQLAERLGVSKRTLETRFREKLQSSPHDFLTRLRVRHAQALMQLSQKRTMEETALESGFGSVQAFRKAFRRITGKPLCGRTRMGPRSV